MPGGGIPIGAPRPGPGGIPIGGPIGGRMPGGGPIIPVCGGNQSASSGLLAFSLILATRSHLEVGLLGPLGAAPLFQVGTAWGPRQCWPQPPRLPLSLCPGGSSPGDRVSQYLKPTPGYTCGYYGYLLRGASDAPDRAGQAGRSLRHWSPCRDPAACSPTHTGAPSHAGQRHPGDARLQTKVTVRERSRDRPQLINIHVLTSLGGGPSTVMDTRFSPLSKTRPRTLFSSRSGCFEFFGLVRDQTDYPACLSQAANRL